MNKNEIIDNLPKWFEMKDMESLLKARGFLSLHISEHSRELCNLEVMLPKLKAERKLKMSMDVLSQTGTVQEREAKAMDKLRDLIMREAEIEGKLKAYKHHVEAMRDITNAIAAYLNADR